MTISPLQSPRFGALQILPGYRGGQDDYVLYSDGNATYDTDGVYYMTAKIGENEAVGKVSRWVGNGGNDETQTIAGLLDLVYNHVLNKDAFTPDSSVPDQPVFIGDDGKFHSGADEFCSQREKLRSRLSERVGPDKDAHLFDRVSPTAEDRLIHRAAEEAGHLVIYRQRDNEGRSQLSLTI